MLAIESLRCAADDKKRESLCFILTDRRRSIIYASFNCCLLTELIERVQPELEAVSAYCVDISLSSQSFEKPENECRISTKLVDLSL